MTTLSAEDMRRDALAYGLKPEPLPLSSIEVNTCLAQLFHDNTPLTLELAEQFAAERWPDGRNDMNNGDKSC